MIRHLYIRNFVLIDEISLDFEEGFSALTGETGAGKSIMIDAISLLCAERASASFVMKGKDKAIIEGTFTIAPDSNAYRVLSEAGFDPQEEVTFTREILASGKSTARIDHRIVTVGLMKDCIVDEVDIHGQRDNQYLLNTSQHIRLLDEFLNDVKERDEVRTSYEEWARLCDERDQVLNEEYNENDLEYFRYQLNEIEAADLKPGEDEELEEKEKEYRSVRSSIEKLEAVFNLYDESIAEPFYELNKLVRSIDQSENTEKITEQISDAYYSVSDAVDELRRLSDRFDLSEDEINEMEERLFLIQKMKRKYGRTIEDILEKQADLENRIRMMTNRQEYLDKMNRRIDAAFGDYSKKADVLSRIRKEGCGRLDEAISVHLKDLMLENAVFVTSIKEGKPSANGNDRVEFLISMNRGEEPKPLSRTASGGELSRLMLGLKVIFTRLQGISTVIFDEIDTGVSGPVATAIGRKMKSLAKDCQVFAVTHLAQVASCADSHYLVIKTDDGERTHTSVKELSYDERIDQLALIASGEITDLSRNAAKELYERNRT